MCVETGMVQAMITPRSAHFLNFFRAFGLRCRLLMVADIFMAYVREWRTNERIIYGPKRVSRCCCSDGERVPDRFMRNSQRTLAFYGLLRLGREPATICHFLPNIDYIFSVHTPSEPLFRGWMFMHILGSLLRISHNVLGAKGSFNVSSVPSGRPLTYFE